jgi:hypothetical protein
MFSQQHRNYFTVGATSTTTTTTAAAAAATTTNITSNFLVQPLGRRPIAVCLKLVCLPPHLLIFPKMLTVVEDRKSKRLISVYFCHRSVE